MPLEKLQKQIIDSAWRQADAVEDEARRQAESILRKARERAGEIKKNAEKETRHEIAMAEKEEQTDAELLERRVLLDARGGAVEAVMRRLKQMTVSALKKRGYEKFINAAIEEVGGMARQDKLTMVIGKGDARLVKNFDGKIRYGDVGAGVEFVSRDGKVRIRATLEDLFDEKKEEIETMLMHEMFAPKRTRKRARERKARQAKGARRMKRRGKGKR